MKKTKYYRKQYLCICEGKQEQMYLNHLRSLINQKPQKQVTFNTIIDRSGSLEKRYEDYDAVALFDHDSQEEQFIKYVECCEKFNATLKKRSKRASKSIHHAYSNLNFDLWLILHKKDFNRSVCHNHAYQDEVRKVYGLSNKEDIKQTDNVKKILNQISLDDVKKAIERAATVRQNKSDHGRRIGQYQVYSNPDFSIHEFVKIVLIGTGDWESNQPSVGKENRGHEETGLAIL